MAENQDVELHTIKCSAHLYKRPRGSYKVTFAGASDVGKTSLFKRILKQNFSDIKQRASRRIDCGNHEEVFHEHETVIPFTFWDTVDMERYWYDEYSELHYYRGSHFVLLVYSANDEYSLHRLQAFASDFDRCYEPTAKLILVRNKIDLPIENVSVPEEKEKLFLRGMNGTIHANFWTSAKTNEGVENMLRELGKLVLNEFESKTPESKDHPVRLDSGANYEQENQGFSCRG